MFNTVEDVSHLIPAEEFGDHYSKVGDRVRVRIFFFIKPEDPKKPIDLRFVTVPTGYPIYRLRTMIKHVTQELVEIYGYAYRANIVLVRKEGEEDWKVQENPPLLNVVFI